MISPLRVFLPWTRQFSYAEMIYGARESVTETSAKVVSGETGEKWNVLVRIFVASHRVIGSFGRKFPSDHPETIPSSVAYAIVREKRVSVVLEVTSA